MGGRDEFSRAYAGDFANVPGGWQGRVIHDKRYRMGQGSSGGRNARGATWNKLGARGSLDEGPTRGEKGLLNALIPRSSVLRAAHFWRVACIQSRSSMVRQMRGEGLSARFISTTAGYPTNWRSTAGNCSMSRGVLIFSGADLRL